MSTNLTDWADASLEFQETSASDNGNGTSLVTSRQTPPIASDGTAFVRIAVQK